MIKLQAEGSESYVCLGSQPNMECSGCSKLRKEVDSLRNMLMSPSVHQRDDDARCYSTHISENKQMEIDKMLLEARSKADIFQQAYEKVENVTSYLSSVLNLSICHYQFIAVGV